MTYHLGNYYKPECPPIENESGELVKHSLTDHEVLIIARLINGQTESEIACDTGRSRNTIKNHLANARQKTDTNSSLELVIWLINQRLQDVYNTSIARLITIDGG